MNTIYQEPISRDTLWTLERYAQLRPAFRDYIIQHKKNKTVTLGSHLTLLFEDTLTIRYQIQEMLRIEKTFEESGIQDELSAYLPLLPKNNNLTATMMLEYPVVSERRLALQQLRGIEQQVYIQVAGYDKVYAIADEDLSRENNEKTSAVHFMRFALDTKMVHALKDNEKLPLIIGVSHLYYTNHIECPEIIKLNLIQDL